MQLKKKRDIIFNLILFRLREAGQLFAGSRQKSGYFFLLLFSRYVLIALNLILIVNINYFLEVNSGVYLTNSFLVSFYRLIGFMEKYHIILYLLLVVFVFLLCRTNSRIFSYYYSLYRAELKLIHHVVGESRRGEMVLWILGGFINLISILSAWFITSYLYSYCSKLLVNFCFLDIFNFRLTLFLLLMGISFLTIFISGNYIRGNRV